MDVAEPAIVELKIVVPEPAAGTTPLPLVILGTVG